MDRLIVSLIVAVAIGAPSPARAMPARWALSPTESADPQRREPSDELSRLLARLSPPGKAASGLSAEAFEDDDLAILDRLDATPLVLADRAADLLGDPGALAAGTGCDLALDEPTPLATFEIERGIGAPAAEEVPNGHFDEDGTWVEYDQIPRREDRPEEYVRYRYPIDAHEPFVVTSGYDLDKPDAEQRRGWMRAVGHGGVDVAVKRGTPVIDLRLEHQIGDAEVLYVGWLFGKSVITRHTIREGGRTRDYVVILGHLQEPADGVRRGLRLRAGQLVGFVGDSGSPELVHLHLEARRVRDGVDAWAIAPTAILLRDVSTVSDPRNVLPLKAARRRAYASCTPRLFPPTKRSWIEGFTLSIDGPSYGKR